MGKTDEAVRFSAESLVYMDDPAVRARLVRLVGSQSAATEAIEAARGTPWEERSVELARVSPGVGTLEFVAVFTNGSQRPVVRAVDEHSVLAPLLEHVRRASFPVVFPNGTPAKILTDGRLVCQERGGPCVALLLFGFAFPLDPTSMTGDMSLAGWRDSSLAESAASIAWPVPRYRSSAYARWSGAVRNQFLQLASHLAHRFHELVRERASIGGERGLAVGLVCCT